MSKSTNTSMRAEPSQRVQSSRRAKRPIDVGAPLPDDVIATINPELPKAAQIYEVIRHAIVSLALKPGAIINEKEICDRLGTSRTPFREAILKLNNEHLVTIVPNSGTYVAKINLQDVFDGQLIRDALELRAVRFAASRMTPEFERDLDFNVYQQKRFAAEKNYDRFYLLDEQFHFLICSFGTSERVWQVVHEAKAQLDRIRRLAFPTDNHMNIVLAEHLEVFEALKARDPDLAVEAMSRHLRRVFRTIRMLLDEDSEYFHEGAVDMLKEYELAIP
ncbi:GntR family transcriptional regulator [Bauldia sp.]|uniref:GntR family transcriptional regulator n=1 Tax=Bauldia sp. TaxID=2575872 RepID=UPI003BAA5812